MLLAKLEFDIKQAVEEYKQTNALGTDELALLEAAYHFCEAVLAARWPQVQALTGALLACHLREHRAPANQPQQTPCTTDVPCNPDASPVMPAVAPGTLPLA